MARRQKGSGRLSKEQLYNFIKVSTGLISLDEDQDPAKGASATILKYGVGSGATTNVQGGYLHFLAGDTWTPTNMNNGRTAYSGAGKLYGMALGERNKYNGTPAEVGMLLRGVIAVYAYGTAAVGSVVYGQGTFSGKYGYFDFTAPSSTGDHVQVFGHCLKIINAASINTVLIYFNPDSHYTIV